MSSPDPVHEFKNQLGIVLGFTELLLAEPDQSERLRADLVEIQKAAQRAMELLAEFADRIRKPP